MRATKKTGESLTWPGPGGASRGIVAESSFAEVELGRAAIATGPILVLLLVL